MIWSQHRINVVRGLLLSLLLCAIPACAAAQQKKPPAAAPAKPAEATKPAPASKPAETPKPAEAPKPAPKPATSATPRPSAAPRTNPSGAARPGTSVQPRTGNANGTRTNGTKANSAAAAAKAAEAERVYQPPVVVARPGGGKVSTNSAGHSTEYNPAGKKTTFETRSGTKAGYDQKGYIRTIHTKSGMTINHGSHGERRYETRRADGARIVGFGRGRGFAEHVYSRGGHPFMRRTYIYNGHRFAYAYRGYYWHGHPYYGYVPPRYYASAYYGWARTPWGAPVAYAWGWNAAPWYRSSGYYFAASPVYNSAALWLTDYLLAANLQAEYDSRTQASAGGYSSDAAPADGQATITPEMKQQIADEVAAQIQSEQQEEESAPANAEPDAPVSNTPPPASQNGPDVVPAALDPNLKTFLVSMPLSESMADGTQCSLSPGDILTRVQDTPDSSLNVKVVVASSQHNDCAAGTQVAVAVTDLQDMHNDFRAKLSEGLGTLAENEGKNGIPTGPPAASKPNPSGQAQPDLTVEADLKAQQDEVAQAESDIQQASVITPGSDD